MNGDEKVWPPRPSNQPDPALQEAKAAARAALLGLVSLVLSSLGAAFCAAFVGFVFYITVFHRNPLRPPFLPAVYVFEAGFLLSGLLLPAGLALGVAGRRSGTGRAGRTVAALFLLLFLAVWAYRLLRGSLG